MQEFREKFHTYLPITTTFEFPVGIYQTTEFPPGVFLRFITSISRDERIPRWLFAESLEEGVFVADLKAMMSNAHAGLFLTGRGGKPKYVSFGVVDGVRESADKG